MVREAASQSLQPLGPVLSSGEHQIRVYLLNNLSLSSRVLEYSDSRPPMSGLS